MLMEVMRMTPTQIARHRSVDMAEKRVMRLIAHTGEDSASLLDIKAMVGREDQRNRSKLEVENCPAERNPKGEEKNHGFGNEHI